MEEYCSLEQMAQELESLSSIAQCQVLQNTQTKPVLSSDWFYNRVTPALMEYSGLGP